MYWRTLYKDICYVLTHWGLVTQWVSKLIVIGSDNGLSPRKCKAIIWINARMLLIQPFREILIEIRIFSLKKMHLKMSSAKCRPFCLGLNVLIKCFSRGTKRSPSDTCLTVHNGFCQDRCGILWLKQSITDSKVHGANMGLTWVLSAPDVPHVGPMNLAIRDGIWSSYRSELIVYLCSFHIIPRDYDFTNQKVSRLSDIQPRW